MTRALKFHHRERLKKKRSHWWGRNISNDPAALGKAVNTPTPCSCWMCGNDRRIHGPTVQERRVQIKRPGQVAFYSEMHDIFLEPQLHYRPSTPGRFNLTEDMVEACVHTLKTRPIEELTGFVEAD